MKLKVCGLTQLPQIQELISMKVNFLGFIFYDKSPRFVLNHLSLSQINSIEHSGKVGVFVNESAENIVEIVEKAGLNFVQLHGDEDENYISELRTELNEATEIIKVIRVGDNKKAFKTQLGEILNIEAHIFHLLFDTDSRSYGGTGKTFDWEILNQSEIKIPYFLSGGISFDNIKNISLLQQKPFALDINSKFETEPGIKDIEKIKILYEKL